MMMPRLDKKECRKFAIPGVSIDARQGIFCAKQIAYIVRTAVKNINRSRTLVLYIYDRARAACGDAVPAWTVYQTKDDYIALARRENGSTRWQTAAFDRLGGEYNFPSRCAFYTAGDEKRLCRFFHAEDASGFASLIAAQEKIQERRRKARADRRDRQTLQRMAGIPPLPRGLERWTRSVMPAYIFYSRRGQGQTTFGFCTSCCHEVTIDNARHNAKAVCSHCGREVTVKSRGKRGRIYNRDTAQVVQRLSSGEVVVRIVKVHYDYGKDYDLPTVSLIENARQFVKCGEDGGIRTEYFYDSYRDGGLTSWKRGSRPRFSQWQYSFECDTCGHVYLRNLPGALQGTPFQYAPISQFCRHFAGEQMQLLPFLRAHLEHPRFEHLVKTGFYTLASDLAYHVGYAYKDMLDETHNRTHRILRIAAEDVAFLCELDAGMGTLKTFQGYAALKDRQRLMRWQMGNKVERDIMPVLKHMTAHKLMRYAEQQQPALCTRQAKHGGQRYRDMQAIVSEYRDYLDMCVRLGYDMGNSFVLYPRDLQKAHDRAARKLKMKADMQMRRDFKAAYRSISQQMDFEADGMRIMLPSGPEDLAAEGNALHHCVGGYADRVAKGECIILFLRRCDELTKPFFTIEIRGGAVAQVRGMKNCPATPEVERFMGLWERQVLQAAA